MTSKTLLCDVAIVGGGMVGASLALALRQTALRVLLVESVRPGAATQPSFDDRTTAIGNGSRQIFASLGVWTAMAQEAAPIRRIHVSDAGHFGFARLDAVEQGVDAFGYVVANRVMGRALWEHLGGVAAAHPQSLQLRMPARAHSLEVEHTAAAFQLDSEAAGVERVCAQLVVAADGAYSSMREAAGLTASTEEYDQVAIVANVAADRPHSGVAFERFTTTGPLAVLPLFDGSYTVVWTLAPGAASAALALDDRAFLETLQRSFGWRAGRLVRVGKRSSYSLRLTRAEQTTGRRVALIGNAAQALHPVAGQGFNLGLRDAAILAEVLADAQGDVGADSVLEDFAHRRAADRAGVTRFTDGLVRLFADERPGLPALRNLGLLLFDVAPSAKSALARISWGFSGTVPRLARGLALNGRRTGSAA